MSVETADILTSLYALRSQAGVVRVHAQTQRKLSVAAAMADIQEQVSGLIEATQKADGADQFNREHTSGVS